MHMVAERREWAVWLVLAILAGSPAGSTWAGLIAAGQAAGRPVAPGEKELEPAVRKAREGRVDEALAMIREQTARHPEWPPAPLILARILLSIDQGAAGRRALERAAAEAPKHPDIYLTLGTLALSDGRFSDARLNFENALALIDAGRLDAEKVKLYRREGLAGLTSAAEGQENWAAARGYLNTWLELEPRNGHARQRLGSVLFRLNQPDDAFAALKQAVQDAPSLEPAAVSMARLASQKGDQKQAQEWFDRAAKLEPTNPRVHVAHAGWLLDQGRATAARAEIDRALKLDPKSNDGRRLLGLIAWHLRDLAAAETTLESVHRDAPADLTTTNLLALCLIEQDDPAKKSRGLQLAEADAQQAPRSPEALAVLGWARFRSGQPEAAEQLLRFAVQGGRTGPDVGYFLARVLADRGKVDDARKVLQSITDGPGAFAHREDARALLKSLAR